ncbi:MAG: MaoC/PaaZ C-terminal domain-containing protein, partial [Pseudomonadota bacterium]
MSTATSQAHAELPKSYMFEDLELGQTATLSHQITEADTHTFAALSGDTNPVHVDPTYASQTLFKACIAHGMMTG